MFLRPLVVLVVSTLAVSADLGSSMVRSQTPAPAQGQGRGRGQAQAQIQNFTTEQRQLVDAAVPSQAPAKPKRPRRLLVMTRQMRDGALTKGPSYFALPAQSYALEQMGKRTGAYEAVVSDDVELFRPGKIDQFDAICFCNSLGVLTDDPILRKSVLDFVAGGKGIIGIHDGLATFVQWPVYDQFPDFGQMLGGTENGGHPYEGELTIKVEDPSSPLNASFNGQSFTIDDQAFQLQEPTLRDRLHVLLAIDPVTTTAPARRFNEQRAGDKDFPMAWIKTQGKGRVFFSAFGHYDNTFWNPTMLRHYLAGIQYALGDLAADDKPSGKVVR
jgi:type 1 glutamine amidotransferase